MTYQKCGGLARHPPLGGRWFTTFHGSEDFAKCRALWEYIWVVRKDNQAFETWSGVTEIGTVYHGFIMGL